MGLVAKSRLGLAASKPLKLRYIQSCVSSWLLNWKTEPCRYSCFCLLFFFEAFLGYLVLARSIFFFRFLSLWPYYSRPCGGFIYIYYRLLKQMLEKLKANMESPPGVTGAGCFLEE